MLTNQMSQKQAEELKQEIRDREAREREARKRRMEERIKLQAGNQNTQTDSFGEDHNQGLWSKIVGTIEKIRAA